MSWPRDLLIDLNDMLQFGFSSNFKFLSRDKASFFYRKYDASTFLSTQYYKW